MKVLPFEMIMIAAWSFKSVMSIITACGLAWVSFWRFKGKGFIMLLTEHRTLDYLFRDLTDARVSTTSAIPLWLYLYLWLWFMRFYEDLHFLRVHMKRILAPRNWRIHDTLAEYGSRIKFEMTSLFPCLFGEHAMHLKSTLQRHCWGLWNNFYHCSISRSLHCTVCWVNICIVKSRHFVGLSRRLWSFKLVASTWKIYDFIFSFPNFSLIHHH